MKKVVFITPEDTVPGFGLAGVSQLALPPEEAVDRLKKLMETPDCGLIIIDERTIKEIDEEKIRDMEKRWGGIFVALPSPVKPTAEIEDYAVRLIRRAIGYHVRLRL